MIALSLVLLIGLVGQISLAQAAFVGIGAFTAALGTRRFGLAFPASLVVGTAAGALTASVIGGVALRVRGLYLAVATLIFGYLCDQYLFSQAWLVDSQSGTSIPAQTIGKAGTLPFFDLADAHVFYYIAIAVAAFALYNVANLRDSKVGRAFAAVRGSEVAAASLGVDVTRFKLLAFAVSGALAGLGGSLILVGQRTVAPTQFNFVESLYFLSIAVVGGLRSLGGAVTSAIVFALLVGEVFYRVPALANYLDVISAVLLMAVLLFFRGGLGAIPERLRHFSDRFALSGRTARVTRLLGSKVPRRQHKEAAKAGPQMATVSDAAVEPVLVPGEVSAEVVAEETESSEVLPSNSRREILRRFRRASGLPAVASPVMDIVALADRLSRVTDEAKAGSSLRVELGQAEKAARHAEALRGMLAAIATEGRIAGAPTTFGRREPVLMGASGITVRFGGLTAVSDASIEVCAGEIVGLIGPNGAGKTTLFNSVLGLNTPTEGAVRIFDQEVTTWAVHRRARLGVGRTFQVLQLFGDLTVFENLMVATHLQNKTGLIGGLFVTSRAQRREEEARARVEAALSLMDLEQYADRSVAGLPFGVLRLVEVARTLVTGAPLVCFDEPASGLDSAETERLIEWFRFLRNIGITLLVIEHDVSMVVRLCDYIYVLDQGKLIAQGPPAAIQRDPHVIASYLGTAMEEAS